MITAVILAAGASKRMGQPKMLLPWGNGTVLTQVITVFQNAGIEDILVITGGARQQVEELVSSLSVRTAYNENHTSGEMVSSIQCGIKLLTSQTQAILIGLGDQPQVQEGSVRLVCEAYRALKSNLVVPSYQKRRGHPWLVAYPFWDELLAMKSPRSPRDFLNTHHDEIQYVEVNDPNILADLDTPEDYQRWRPLIP